MRKTVMLLGATLAICGAAAPSALADDTSVRATIKQFQPTLAEAGADLNVALHSKGNAAGYASLDAATRKLLATLKTDHNALAATQASTTKVATARAQILAALTRLSQAVAALDRGLQAAKIKDKSAAIRELTAAKIEFKRAADDEVVAAKLLS